MKAAKNKDLSGIDFVVDEKGKRKAVIIDLSIHGELWEDIYDTMVIEARKGDPSSPIEEVKRRVLEDA